MSTLPVPGARAPRGLGQWLARRSSGARLHAGVDLQARRGTVVVAPEGGTVLVAGPEETARAVRGWGWRGYGPQVILLAGESGMFHVLSHVESVAVSAGDVIREGVPVAVVSAKAHLHWEVQREPRPTRGRAVVEDSIDPMAWLEGRIVPYDGRAPEAPSADLRTPVAHRATRPTMPADAPAGPKENHGS